MTERFTVKERKYQCEISPGAWHVDCERPRPLCFSRPKEERPCHEGPFMSDRSTWTKQAQQDIESKKEEIVSLLFHKHVSFRLCKLEKEPARFTASFALVAELPDGEAGSLLVRC